jgi:hypothetical protein
LSNCEQHLNPQRPSRTTLEVAKFLKFPIFSFIFFSIGALKPLERESCVHTPSGIGTTAYPLELDGLRPQALALAFAHFAPYCTCIRITLRSDRLHRRIAWVPFDNERNFSTELTRLLADATF